jgi:hypothetical protein
LATSSPETKVRETPKFLLGVERLVQGLEKGYTIAMMCSESEPFNCHRFSMISYYLVRNNFEVQHILKDKTSISNEDLEKRNLKKYVKQIPQTTLFEVFSWEDQLNLAYHAMFNCALDLPCSKISNPKTLILPVNWLFCPLFRLFSYFCCNHFNSAI